MGGLLGLGEIGQVTLSVERLGNVWAVCARKTSSRDLNEMSPPDTALRRTRSRADEL
jgi:hypothetical protein